jgi:hypothetical protein
VLSGTITGGTATITLTQPDFASNYIVGIDDSTSLTDAKSQNNYFIVNNSRTVNITSGQAGRYGGLRWNPTISSIGSFLEVPISIETTTAKNGFGTASPTAMADITGSTTTNASFRLRSGTAPSSPNDGDHWYDGTNLFTRVSSTTYTIAKCLTASATLDFPSTGAGNNSDLTITVTGAALNDPVVVGVPNGSVTSDSCYTAWVSSANTVTVRFNNYDTLSSHDPASGTFKVTVIKF